MTFFIFHSGFISQVVSCLDGPIKQYFFVCENIYITSDIS